MVQLYIFQLLSFTSNKIFFRYSSS